ncbi:unnamed protein product [Brassica oleracea]|uniref:(rape) hypothetical protein n=1 Tax=Brassica napus TaxID=3708 RepID=A0A816K2X2_BRANA|nr:unnamed protein product [Brassica napus]
MDCLNLGLNTEAYISDKTFTYSTRTCGFSYVTHMEGGSDILFDSDIPEIQYFKSQ